MSLGVFQELVELYNRAPEDLTVFFDGQSKTLKPGLNMVPELVVQFAKNQNPIMGSQDPHNPHISGARYLVGVKGPNSLDEIEPLTKEEWEDHLNRPCREDEQISFQDKYSGDPKARLVVRGKGRKSTANSRYEAGGSMGADSASGFSGKD